jgi:hypothetical protein
MTINKKTKVIFALNTLFLTIVAIEEAKVIELLPFKDEVKTSIKGVILALVTILNVVIAQLKLK